MILGFEESGRPGIDVCCARVEELLPDDAAYATAYASLPEFRRRKADAFRFAGDRRRSVAVWLLLRRLLAGKGIDVDVLQVTENGFGKPAFDPSVGIQFSLSHAGERVMAAVSSRPVGCDVEQVAPLRNGVAEACLTDAELEFVHAVPSGPDRDRAFCRLWVRKESYVKACGAVFSFDPRLFSVLSDAVPCAFRDFDFADGYLGCAVDTDYKSLILRTGRP